MYLARDLELGVYRAVKELPLNRKREAKLLRLLDHPFLPAMTDYTEQGDHCYLVMEYIRGKSLRQYLEDGRIFTAEEGSSANIRKSNIPCTLTLRLINLYYSGHTWYALPSSTCCLSPQQIRLIMDWQRNFRQHQDLFPGLPQNERVPLGLIFYNGQ